MSFGQISTSTISSGLVGAGLSYFYLRRENVSDIFGFNVPEWALDGVLIGISSAAGKIVAAYIIPFLPTSLFASSGMQSFISMSLVPVCTGGVLALGKPLLVDTFNEEKMTEFLLGAGSQLVGDKIASMWSGMK